MESVDVPTRCLGVVMPVHDEERTLHLIVEKVLARPEVGELVIVDDGSTDGTWVLIQALAASDSRIRVVRCERNRGKSAALRTGFAQATSEILIVQDADLEYDPDDYPKLLAPILAGRADVVYGSRFQGATTRGVVWSLHALANKLLTRMSNMVTGLHLTDMQTCYKMFRKSVIDRIRIQENRFGFEPEFTAKVAKLEVPIEEVGISYRGRSYADGKKIGWKDGVSAIRCIVHYGFQKSG
jgi:glycosyltransferase involved in cell wall biosynthesis